MHIEIVQCNTNLILLQNMSLFNTVLFLLTGEPLVIDMELALASFDGISEVNMVSKLHL